MSQLPTGRLEKIIAWLIPSMSVLVFVIIFWTSLFFMPMMINAGDGDLGRHITTGNFILTMGQIPTQDIFSHTMPGAPFVPMEWLSDVLFALAFRAAGLNGVAWLTALVLAACYTLLTWGMRRLGVSALVALAGAFAASVVGSLHALTRPHIFTWLFFALFLCALEDYRHTGRRRLLWLLPPLMVIWANLHSAFISGWVLIVFSCIGAALEKERRRVIELSGLLVVVVLASFINPVGVSMVSHAIEFLQNRFLIDTTVEYTSPNFHVISTWPFAALLLLSFALIGRTGRRLSWTPLILLAGWTAFALYSVRNIPLYALVAVLLLAPTADELIREMLPGATRFLGRIDQLDGMAWGWVWAGVAVVWLVGSQWSGAKLDAWGKGNAFDPHVFPVAAVDRLEESMPAGNMFNEFTWGGYLVFRLWPEKKVFIDGFTDFYGEALTREYLQAVNAEPGWESILDRYNVNWVIVPPSRPLAVRLDESPGWLLQYKDDTAGVWVRR